MLLLLGIVLFSFFQEATQNSVISVVAQEGVVRKTQFPRLVIPLATVLTCAFNLCLNLVDRLRLHPRLGSRPDLDLAALPVRPGAALHPHRGGQHGALGPLRALPRHRDHLDVVSQVLFYGTPILYPITAVPDDLPNTC